MSQPVVYCSPEQIPAELRELRQWVVWRLDPPLSPHAKPRKLLYSPHDCTLLARTHNRAGWTGEPASSTWGSYEQAVSSFSFDDQFAGVGFVFTADDPYCGFDMDGCRDPATGVLSAEAQFAVDLAGTYTEISQSGCGIKMVARARKPGSRCRNDRQGVEMYDNGRYFALTGYHLASTPAVIEERQAQFEGLYAYFLGQSVAAPQCKPLSRYALSLDDSVLIEKALGYDKFRRLWQGDCGAYGGNHSSADLALCGSLAYWTSNDRDRIDRLFRQSSLMRAKWDEYRGSQTYGERTVERAVQGR